MRKTLAALTFVVLGASVAGAETYTVDKAHSDVSFQIRHMMAKTRGRFGDFEANVRIDRAKPEASTVEFRVKAASIDTANTDRDKHLRSADFFDVEKHPEIVFKSSKIVPRGSDVYDVTGTLSLRGVEKQITLPVTLLGFGTDPWGNQKAGFETRTVLNRKEFGMVWNKALDMGGVLLDDEVSLAITLELNKTAPAAD